MQVFRQFILKILFSFSVSWSQARGTLKEHDPFKFDKILNLKHPMHPDVQVILSHALLRPDRQLCGLDRRNQLWQRSGRGEVMVVSYSPGSSTNLGISMTQESASMVTSWTASGDTPSSSHRCSSSPKYLFLSSSPPQRQYPESLSLVAFHSRYQGRLHTAGHRDHHLSYLCS